MNVETLLEAARFIELQELKQKNGATVNHAEEPTRNGHSGSTNHAAAPTTRGSFSTGLHRSSTGSPAVTLYAASAGSSGRSDAGTTSPLVVDEGSDNKRRSGPSLMRSGTREVHNKLEKNRRAHLKECFELLKRQLPAQPDEKKSSNLSILHSALRFIQVLRRRERDYEHEMERLAREKIAFQQRLASLKKELSAQWDHIDFNAILPDQLDNTVPVTYSNSVHNREESGHASDGDELGTSGAVYSSTSSLSSAATASSPTGAHVTPIPAALSVVQQNGTSPILLPGNSSPEAPSSSTDKPPQTTAPTLVHHPTLHLPLSQVMSAQGLVVSPTIQLVAGTQGLRVLQAGGDRQLTLLQTSGSDRPLALVQTTATTHLDLTTTGSNVSNRLQEPITTSPALHKVVSGSVALVPASQANFRTAKGLTLANGLTLGPTAVTLASGKQSVTSDSIRTTGVTHVVPSHTSLSGLAPLTPLVVSQGSQVAHIIAAPSQLNGKVMTTPLLKSVGQVPLVNAQYLSTTLVKPVVVVSTPSSANLPPSSS